MRTLVSILQVAMVLTTALSLGCSVAQHFCEPEEPYRCCVPENVVPTAVVTSEAPPVPAEQAQRGRTVAHVAETKFEHPAGAPQTAEVALASATAAATLDPPPVPQAGAAETADPATSSPAIDATLPISLASALQMTAGRNPRLGFAEERIREAEARLAAAEALWLPSIRGGVNYNKHEGRIQDVVGNLIETSRGSVYTGLGAGAVGAGSPSVPGLVMQFHLRDALLQPRIAENIVAARQHANRAAVNDALLATAHGYLDLLEAYQLQAVAEETLAHARQLATMTADFERAGQGTAADADRARTESSLREIELSRAEEAIRVAAVRLIQQLSLEQQLTPVPQEAGLAPIELVAAERTPAELIALGMMQRPELAEAQFLVAEATQRLRREQVAPFVPSVLLGLSYGANSAGLGSDLIRPGDRLDFDAMAFWELRNLGQGDAAARRETSSLVRQARWQQIRVLDQVAAEIAEAHAQVDARRKQVELAQKGVAAAQDSYRRNLARIRDGQGLPIEVLQSLQALDQARRQLVRVIADYDRAQFRLLRAIGWVAQ